LSVSQRTHERWGSWSILQPQEITTQSINFLHTINFLKKILLLCDNDEQQAVYYWGGRRFDGIQGIAQKIKEGSLVPCVSD
jgi:hypothetical protein